MSKQCDSCQRTLPNAAFPDFTGLDICASCLIASYKYVDEETLHLVYIEPVNANGEATKHYTDVQAMPSVLPLPYRQNLMPTIDTAEEWCELLENERQRRKHMFYTRLKAFEQGDQE